MPRMLLGAVFICSAVFLVGCGPSPCTVSGDVTIDGKLAEMGTITYASAIDDKAPPGTVEFKNGKYEIKTFAGKKFVSISVHKVIDKRKESDAPNAPMVDITEEVITVTNLEFELKAGPNTKDWKLDSKGK